MNIQKYCLDMIESILCYDCKGYKTAKDVLDYENNAYHNYLSDYIEVLGENRVLELIQNRIDAIDHVVSDVYTDSEGCSYNSIIWKRGYCSMG